MFPLNMANPYFKFKKFTVWQNKCAMKVGTDGVLLGAWANANYPESILDIGTGTGLVALMLAQRFDAFVTAIEIDEDAYYQATENVRLSPWSNRIQVVHGDFTTYHPAISYDLIVCNPPYFVDSLKSPDDSRTTARHNQSLTYNDLFEGVSLLLKENGTFCLIIPTDVAEQVTITASNFNLYTAKRLNIKTAPGKFPKRCMLAFGFDKVDCITNELLIEIERHKYSNEFIALAKDFYLKI